MALSYQHQRFADEFVACDGNGAKAAVRAGYSKRRARQTAHDLVTNRDIAEEIEKQRRRLAEKVQVKAEKILAEYMRIAFSDIRDVAEWTGKKLRLRASKDIDPDAAAVIAEVGRTED